MIKVKKSLTFHICLPFLILAVVGLIAHFQTLKFGLFGDDWLSIYFYLSQEKRAGFFNNLPGLLKYLTQYGAQVFFTGTAYKIFSQNYYYYYLTTLVLKVLASFSFYLATKNLGARASKREVDYICLFGAVLLLVGYSGIQTADYFVQTGVFLSAFLFFLSIYFLTNSFKKPSGKNNVLAILFGIFSLIISPYRLFPFIVIFPLLSVFLAFYYKPKNLYKLVISLVGIWIFFIFVLWLIGLFSSPGMLPPTYLSAIRGFLDLIYSKPIKTLLNIFQWLGVIIAPDGIITKTSRQILVGSILVTAGLFSFYVARKDMKTVLKLSIAVLPMIIFLIFMFVYNPNRVMSSQDRYLIMIFYGFCFFITLAIQTLYHSLKKMPKIIPTSLVFILASLALVHFVSIQKLYGEWLSNGRSADFIKETEIFLHKNFDKTIDSDKIVFLDFDNSKTLYYIQYGLDFKILVLTNTLNQDHFPAVLIDKDSLYKRIENLSPKERIRQVNDTYGYSFNNGVFSDSTHTLRKELENLFSD